MTIAYRLISIQEIERNWDKVSSFLGGQILKEAEKYVKKEDQFRHLGGLYLFKKYVGEEKPSYTENGKPLSSKTCVSITHSGDFAGLAIAPNPIGIDLEALRPVKERVAAYIGQKGVHAPSKFFPIWCAKESYLKCTGEGLAGNGTKAPYRKGIVEINGTAYSIQSGIFQDYAYGVCLKQNEPFDVEIVIEHI